MGKPAHPEVGGHHALAGDHLKHLKDLFPLAEAVEEDGHRAYIQGVCAKPYQMRVDASQLVEHEANPHGAWRNLKPQQLFNRQHVRQVVGHGAEVVDAVGERHDLLVELCLAGLFDSGVQKADVRTNSHYGFAVDFQHEAKHAVGRGVLRTHVDDHGAVAIDGLDNGCDAELINACH